MSLLVRSSAITLVTCTSTPPPWPAVAPGAGDPGLRHGRRGPGRRGEHGAPPGLAGRAGGLPEDLVHLVGDVLDRRVADLHQLHQLAAAGPVDRLDELLDAPDVDARVGDQQQVGRDGLQVGALRGDEVAHDAAHLVGVGVLEPDELGDGLLGGRRLDAVGGVGRDGRLLGVGGADQLPVPPGLVEGDAVGGEGRQEGRVGLVGGDRRLGEERDLPLGHVLAVDEVPAGPAAGLLQDVDDVGLGEGEHEAPLDGRALGVGPGAAPPACPAAGCGGAPARRGARRRRRGGAGHRRRGPGVGLGWGPPAAGACPGAAAGGGGRAGTWASARAGPRRIVARRVRMEGSTVYGVML